MISFKDKVALVTGGAQGIGKGIVQAFSHQGAAVIIADIDEEAGQEVVAWLTKKGADESKLVFVKTDVSREEDIRALIDRAIAEFGRLDFVVNNAGLSEFKPIDECSVEDWKKVIDTNLTAAFLTAKYAAPHLKQHTGSCIVNIASTRAKQAEESNEAYSASKGGLLSLTQALAVSLGPAVRVNAISPGWIEVRDWQKASERKSVEHTQKEKMQHPAGRVGHPEDIGRAAVFLCSGEAGFITGHNLVIDGGMSKRMIYLA